MKALETYSKIRGPGPLTARPRVAMYRLPFPPVVSKFQSPSPTYREGREDQLGASGLVVNAVGLWTSFYPDRTVKHLREQ